MKKNQKIEVFGKDIKTLRSEVRNARNELLDLIIDNKQFKLKDTKSLSRKKKDIAVMLTAIREKELSK